MATPADRWDKSEFVIILEGIVLVNVFLSNGKGERTLDYSQVRTLTLEHFPDCFYCCPYRDVTSLLAPSEAFTQRSKIS
jgi:hypothetical protein